MIRIILLAAAFTCASQLHAQEKLEQFNHERMAINKKAFLVLGSWSAANIVSGIAGLATVHSGQAKYFHQMNLAWGCVNMLIAVPAYLNARRGVTAAGWSAGLQAQASIERTFIFNAGLDIAYLAGAAWLLERGNRVSNEDQLKGYGKSVLMQGAGLLIFDVIMFSTHHSHGKKLYRLLEGLQAGPNGLGMSFSL